MMASGLELHTEINFVFLSKIRICSAALQHRGFEIFLPSGLPTQSHHLVYNCLGCTCDYSMPPQRDWLDSGSTIKKVLRNKPISIPVYSYSAEYKTGASTTN